MAGLHLRYFYFHFNIHLHDVEANRVGLKKMQHSSLGIRNRQICNWVIIITQRSQPSKALIIQHDIIGVSFLWLVAPRSLGVSRSRVEWNGMAQARGKLDGVGQGEGGMGLERTWEWGQGIKKGYLLAGQIGMVCIFINF